MSVRIMSAVFESKTLSPTERLIMLALADHADDEGRCYPSIRRLCERTALSERALQTNIKVLQKSGHLTVEQNAGQRGVNVYLVHPTPAADAPPQQMHPRTTCALPPQQVRPTPAADAPKPSRTIKEPSESKVESPQGILCQVASPDAVESFLRYRKRQKGGALTPTGAKRLATSLRAIIDGGGDPDDALGMAEERGWQTNKPDWYFNEKNRSKGVQNVGTSKGTDRLRAFIGGAD